MIHWGWAIRAVRQSKGLSQVELARRTGWAQANIARLEVTPDPHSSTIELMALGLDVTCEQIAEAGEVLRQAGAPPRQRQKRKRKESLP